MRFAALFIATLFAAVGSCQDRIESYRVVDGDTVHARVALGWDVHVDAKIRLSGFNAPELREEGGQAAKESLEAFLAAGKEIIVVPTGKKTFDRWVGEIYVDGQSATECLSTPLEMSAPAPVEETSVLSWNDQVQAQLDSAGEIAKRRNKSITVVVAEGEYEFTSLSIPPHVSLVASPDVVRSVRLRYTGGSDSVAIHLKGDLGYGSRLSGFEIIPKDQSVARVTAIKLTNCINPEISRVRVDFRGQDCIALDHGGRESLSVDTVEFRASLPVLHRAGDNASFHNCDFGASGNCSADFPSAIVRLDQVPHQMQFSGYQTWQGGDHAIFAELNSVPSKGQNLNLYNVRWEQSTSRDDPTKAAIHLRFTPRGIENLVLIGCRWTDRARGFNLAGVDGITLLGSRLPGSR